MQTISLRTVAHIDARNDVHGQFSQVIDQLESRIEFEVSRDKCDEDFSGHRYHYVVTAEPKRGTIEISTDGIEQLPESISGTVDVCQQNFWGDVEYEAELISYGNGSAIYQVG